MTRRRRAELFLALGFAVALACSAPPEHPPLGGVTSDADPTPEDSGAEPSTPTCQVLGGRCVDPGHSCPIQITGKDPCGSLDAGPSHQICCAGN